MTTFGRAFVCRIWYAASLVVVWASLPAFGAGDGGMKGGPDHSSRGGDPVCGPRCVQFLVEWYEKERIDLIELVREMQWPDLEKGCGLDAVEKALRRRGIHTYAMRIPGNATLQWPHPVLVHLDRERSSDDESALGHFVVWLPSSSPAGSVWNGVLGLQDVPIEILAKHRTGAVLLTSPVPITEPGGAVRKVGFSAIGLTGVIAVIAAIVFLCLQLKVVRVSASLCRVIRRKKCGDQSVQ